jgi:hypothetical protein
MIFISSLKLRQFQYSGVNKGKFMLLRGLYLLAVRVVEDLKDK